MTIARRRAEVVFLIAALVGALLVWAPSAEAATCQNVPGSTPGTDVRLAGQDHRVPAISNIRVCSDGATAPIVAVDLAGHGNCLSPCLSILLDGNDLDVGAITLSYSKDGVVQTSTTDPSPVDGPGDECLLSVGSPDAPYPTCFNAIGPEIGDPVGDAWALVGSVTTEVNKAVDTAEAIVADAQADAWALVGSVTTEVNKAVDAAEAIVADAQADAVALANSVLAEIGRTLEPVETLVQELLYAANDPCGSIPPQRDPSYWENEVEFCDSPSVWTLWFVQNFCNDHPNRCVAEPQQVIELAQEVYCLVAEEPQPDYCWE
ncbi:MAG: hypothetical protein M3271_09450 [Actinomycetota bacterium]|nr:hypothetical protein [Actinomycetota bacterium]